MNTTTEIANRQEPIAKPLVPMVRLVKGAHFYFPEQPGVVYEDGALPLA